MTTDSAAKKFLFSIDPMGAVRTTRRQQYVDERAIRYRDYKLIIAHAALEQMRGAAKLTTALALKIVFIMPIPASWSKKKRWDALEKPHTSTPDLDNLIKGCTDALNKVVWLDDKQIVSVDATKTYGFEPRIELYVTEVS
ncbi:RusA family crossover junction endodeoxyribonuclease [Brevibacillus porteri]|uniref:RusA family crossover junction endodeoxyribonuclease n=1 Tax=Brevibacillus porteri TaxID=2126350 RepID=UPI003D1A15B2